MQFRVVLIKPSHYDDDGYVIQWYRSAVPSNTLAALYGLTRDIIERKVLGDDVDVVIDAYDETNTRVPIKNIIKQIKSADGGGFVGFVGVQSNQFPRAMDMARQLRDAGIQVCIGGFHVSGCIAMLPKLPEDIQEAVDIGVSLFIGEAEGKLDEVFLDAYAGQLKPRYDYLTALPDIASQPTPILPAAMLGKSLGALSSFDTGRGCPFLCSFCTIINVQGKKSRRRSGDDIEQIVREHAEQGITRFFITDDNMARNRNWEEIFDVLIRLVEEEGMVIRLTIQVDVMCHHIPRFVEKAARAGVARVFIGLESISPDNLEAAKKKQNKFSEYRKMLQAWRNVGVITCAGYILGFPADTEESIVQDIKTIQREMPVDLLEFFYLTPLPGSEDHQKLYQQGAWMDSDMNKYDLSHITAEHPIMSREEWTRAYKTAWDTYYSDEHIETVLKRTRASGVHLDRVLFLLLWFSSCNKLYDVHPLEGGFFRRKYRQDRRSGMPIENPFTFYPKLVWETLSTHVRGLLMLRKFTSLRNRINADPEALIYIDIATTPIVEEKKPRARKAKKKEPATSEA
jgi:radical SAM superfamily enzyme YgiQ (UPF0313 family)